MLTDITLIWLFYFQVGNVSYHDYCGILVNESEKESIIEDLGKENKVGLNYKNCFDY